MFVITRNNLNEKPVAEFTTFGKSAKWLMTAGTQLGGKFQVWSVEVYKRKPNVVTLEAEFELAE